MGISDRFYGRSPKARDRRAAQSRAKYADFPGMTSQLLEVLAQAIDVPSKQQVKLYLEAVPSGAVPRRELPGFRLSSSTTYVGVLGDNAVSVRWAAREDDVLLARFPLRSLTRRRPASLEQRVDLQCG